MMISVAFNRLNFVFVSRVFRYYKAYKLISDKSQKLRKIKTTHLWIFVLLLFLADEKLFLLVRGSVQSSVWTGADFCVCKKTRNKFIVIPKTQFDPNQVEIAQKTHFRLVPELQPSFLLYVECKGFLRFFQPIWTPMFFVHLLVNLLLVLNNSFLKIFVNLQEY